MASYLVDGIFLAVTVAVTLLLVRRSLLDSLTVCGATLISALIALNCFEPAASFISNNMLAANDIWIASFVWFTSLIIIFAWLAAMIWIGFQKALGQTDLQLGRFDVVGRWFFSSICGYMLAAFLLTSMHTFPAPRDYWGAFPPELHRRSSPIAAFGPDYQLLTLSEYISNPRSAISGTPWKPTGPLFETDIHGNRWASFPVRYALWRETTQSLMQDYYPEDANETAIADVEQSSKNAFS